VDVPAETAARCYVCGTPAGSYRRRLESRFSVHTCCECGLEYVSPRPTEAELRAFYASYRDVRADPRVVAANARRHLTLLARHGWSPSLATLDFGAGAGIFVDAAGEQAFGVEWGPSPHARVVAAVDALPARPWGAVTLWGVLEHLPDPVEVLRSLVALLADGGLVALTTVDAESAIPYHYKPPEHLCYWTRRSIELLAAAAALEVVHYEPYTMVQLGDVYLDRLLARTPPELRARIRGDLPPFVEVPTNEVRVVMRSVR
jgi:SAM-dependent methyltransferase